jgi:hypothetical protein
MRQTNPPISQVITGSRYSDSRRDHWGSSFASNSGQLEIAMRFMHMHNVKPDELMGPDLLSEILIAMSGAVVFFLLILPLIAALATK